MSERLHSISLGRILPLVAAAAVFALVWGATSAGAAGTTTTPNHDPLARALQSGSLVISNVTVDGANSTVTISNVGSDSVDLGGLWVCNVPNYWQLPEQTLAPGASITVNAGSGSDTASQLFAGGSIGALGSPGEIALYSSPDFEDPGSILAYVGWNGGSDRKTVAQAAGIWGDDDVSAEVGDSIRRTGTSADASAYSAGSPELIAALPSTGSGGLADIGGGSSSLIWAIVAGGATLLLGLSGRRLLANRASIDKD